MRRPGSRLGRLGVALTLPLALAAATVTVVPAAELPTARPTPGGTVVQPTDPPEPSNAVWLGLVAAGAAGLGLVAAGAGLAARRRPRRWGTSPPSDDPASRDAGAFLSEDLEARLGDALASGQAPSIDRPNPRSRATPDAPIWVRRLDAEIPILPVHRGEPPLGRIGAPAHHESDDSAPG